jgi:SAM-dependent methyltransferase
MSLRKQIRIHIYSPLRQLTSRFEIHRYMAQCPEAKLNIGCGKNILPTWLNVDLYPTFGAVFMNAVRRWPIADNTLSACLCEHMIEHVPRNVAQHLLNEAFRTLKHGGLIRVVTPDLDTLARLITEDSTQEAEEYLRGIQSFFGSTTPISACHAVNLAFYEHGHRYLYTIGELCDLMETIGFDDLRITRGGNYVNPVFDNVDGHPQAIGTRLNELEAFAIEARKPPA